MSNIVFNILSLDLLAFFVNAIVRTKAYEYFAENDIFPLVWETYRTLTPDLTDQIIITMSLGVCHEILKTLMHINLIPLCGRNN